jgi:hypothetical protein
MFEEGVPVPEWNGLYLTNFESLIVLLCRYIDIITSSDMGPRC